MASASVTHGAVGKREPGMPQLIGLGLLAAALFSVVFVLNRAMSLEGGHWVWSASLRYVYMAALLGGWLLLRRDRGYLSDVLRLFWRRLPFWLLAGGLGFGVFYAAICFAADHAPGWITAATWQVTILATPFVLRAFGARVPVYGLAFLVCIFLGVLILNVQRIADGVTLLQAVAGMLPVLVAAVAFPVGNQLLNRAKHAGGKDAEILSDPVASVLLMTLGALPVFIALLAVTAPPLPATSQIISTGIVAVVGGCLATTLFLYARNLSSEPYRIAAVDATQAGEVGFALLGEMLLLGAVAPGVVEWIGLAAVMCGLIGFTLKSR